MIAICLLSMKDIAAHYLAKRSWIGSMPISRHLLGNRADSIDGLLKKMVGSSPISRLAETGINQIAVTINRSIQVTPFSMHLDGCFIDIARLPGLSTSRGFVTDPLFTQQTALARLG
jgi:hypothetical protein